MVLQALMYRRVEPEEIPKPWKRLAVILGWPDLGDGLAPDNVAFYFQNVAAATFHFARRITCYCPSFNTENPERFLDEMRSLKYGEMVSGWKDMTAEANGWNAEPMRGVLRPDGGSRVPTTYRHGAAAVPRRLKGAAPRWLESGRWSPGADHSQEARLKGGREAPIRRSPAWPNRFYA